jgi:polyether ionophore transport system permease protein
MTSVMLRIGLRFHRSGMISVAALGSLNGLLQAAGFKAIVGDSETARVQFGQQMTVLGRQISYLLPIPVHVETIAGYLQWRAFGLLPLVYGFWALMAGTAVIRGEEERGLLELWLANAISRTRLVLARAAAFVLAAALTTVPIMAFTAWGAAIAGSPLPVKGLAVEGIVLLVLASAGFAIALLIAQLPASRRSAAGMAAIVLLALFFLNSVGRTLEGAGRFRAISPFFPADRTLALLPDGPVDWIGMFGWAFAAVALTVLVSVAFGRRDLGSGLVQLHAAEQAPVMEPSSNPLLREPALAAVYEQRLGLTAWIIGAGLLALLLGSVAKSTAEILTSNPVLSAYLAGQGDIGRAIISIYWFGTVSLLLAIFAITQVSRWAGEDTEGRLELLLSQPLPRWRVVLEREGSLLLGAALIAAFGGLVTIMIANAQGIRLAAGPMVGATLLLLPLTLAFGALGAALAGRIPRASVLALSAYAVLAYLLQQVAPLFKLPEWTSDLSIFRLYGTPLTTGVYWTGLWILLVIIVMGTTIGITTMQRREVGR